MPKCSSYTVFTTSLARLVIDDVVTSLSAYSGTNSHVTFSFAPFKFEKVVSI
jgi:hypothetical protein